MLRIGCRLVLAAVFLMAALTKITDLTSFEDQVILHAGLPTALEVVVIPVLPWLELTCGACLVLGYARREAALITTILLAAFIVHGLFTVSERDCGCFLFPNLLPLSQPWWQPARNLLLLAASILVWTEQQPISAARACGP
jgi:uncharacterized membrane protein YphA (DoxX/SURF4 family)